MRYRVDIKFGYVSYDESEYDLALKLYRDEGIRLRRCRDIHDEGVVIEGAPIFEDLTREKNNEN